MKKLINSWMKSIVKGVSKFIPRSNMKAVTRD